jgi:hypothetical protein
MDDTEFNAAAVRFNDIVMATAARFNASAGTQSNGGNQSSSSEKDEAPSSPTEQVIDVTDDVNEEELFHPNFDAEHNFLNELEERSKLGLFGNLEDTYVAFRTLLD